MFVSKIYQTFCYIQKFTNCTEFCLTSTLGLKNVQVDDIRVEFSWMRNRLFDEDVVQV